VVQLRLALAVLPYGPAHGRRLLNANDKRRARLNCIAHFLSLIPYEDLTPPPIKLPPRQTDAGYVRPPLTDQTFVPEAY
jgi:hypothetical protein